MTKERAPSLSDRLETVTASTDLLLFNCSNLAWRPIYPYAFVQIAEVGRRHGLRVVGEDMLHVDDWAAKANELIARLRPRAVGIHLRQVDTVDLSDYYRVETAADAPFKPSYFPVEDSRRLIAILRCLTSAPIMMGGFGFTTHAEALMRDLDIDFGMAGCPDGLFARFDDVLERRNLATVANLIYHDGARIVHNPRAYGEPAPGREYTNEILDNMRAFYGDRLTSADPPTIAVEVSRGCPFSCFFCTEPTVKGNYVRFRNPDVIEDELAFLLSHGFRNFWFVCSELNIRGTDFVFNLAERVLRLGERFPSPHPIKWSGYSLPSFTTAELAALKRAGYTGAINDILSLDDANLRRARVPYKASQALGFLRAMIETRAAPRGGPTDASSKFTANSPDRFEGLISFFLGNAHMDRHTIPRTLERLDASGLQGYYNEGYTIPATRIFPTPGTVDFLHTPTTITFGPNGITPPDVTRPTFHFPALLMERLGSPDAIIRYLDYLATTFLSVVYRRRPKWAGFLQAKIGVDRVIAVLGGDALLQRGLPRHPAKLAAWLADETSESDQTCFSLLVAFFSADAWAAPDVMAMVPGLPFDGCRPAGSEYAITRALYAAWPSRGDYAACQAKLGHGMSAQFLDFCETFANFHYNETYRDLTFDPVRNPQAQAALVTREAEMTL
jgi:hypothetical protein